MAPSRTPKGKKRDADYSNIGVAGRKTGISLKDTGIRDEHGLEPIDGIFSSPEKSPAKQNGNGNHSTITEEEDMDIGESTVPEPTEVLTNRKRNGRSIFPPPHARSPMKTSLGSSPRRSMGPTSSPLRNGETPSRAMSHPLVNRKLDFGMEEPRQSIERSPPKKRPVVSSSSLGLKGGKPLQIPGRGRKRPFDLSMTDEEEEDYSANLNGDETQAPNDTDLGQEYSQEEDDAAPPQIQDDSLPLVQEETSEVPLDTQQELDNLQELVETSLKKKRGRPGRPKKALPEEQASSTTDLDTHDISANPPAAKKRGRPAGKQTVEPEAPEIVPTASHPDQPVKRRGRKKANDEEVGDGQPRVEVEPEKSAKRARHASVEGTLTKSGHKAKQSSLKELDPNAPVVKAKAATKAYSTESISALTAFSKPKSRSLYVLRHETPADDDGSRLLRSGRTSVKPIAYWRGERIVYGESNLDGNNVVLPAIKEVIRTEEVVDPRPDPRPKRKNRRGNGTEKARLQDVEEEDEDQEAWEQGAGILRAEVLQWDPVTQRGVDDNVEDVELALAPVALQGLTREVKGAEFTYAKTLTLPFFHSGMVDLPSGGVKRMKNSRKNHMVFWVFSGRVRVDVSGTDFSIGRGGMWQVPRGNFYSIANQHQKPARVFFAQGCYMEAGPGEPGEGEVGSS
ncbi:hypothetical protein MMC13_008362 [Lambiella insularis]|nr:hypothetical protein [Lambiella insularis]